MSRAHRESELEYMPRGRKVDKELRLRIAKLLKAGKSQAEIGRIMDRAPGTIAHHVRALGVAPKEYSVLFPMKRGKRRCVTCRKMKTPGAYPGKRNAECTMCVRAKKGAR
jgi:IS30 family transposase